MRNWRTVTLDTGVVDQQGMAVIRRLEAADVKTVSTVVRERGDGGREYLSGLEAIAETAVWGESRWGEAVWGGGTEQRQAGALFDPITRIITNGTFPAVEPSQLRDAIIFEAHAREGRDLFITTDSTAFVSHGRRKKLEALANTEILTVVELSQRLS